MADIVSKEKRSEMMSGIRGKDTRPEILVRKALHAKGFRYRLQYGKLPGRPDIVLPKYHAVVFVNGCFWHLHGCRLSTIPKTRTEFWKAKLEGNRERDRKNIENLQELGWRVAVIWECAIKGGNSEKVDRVVSRLAEWIRSDSRFLSIGEADLSEGKGE